MPAVFKKIKVKAKAGRGEGTDGMLTAFLAQYDDIKAIFDGASQSEKDEVVAHMNKFQEDLGTAFATDKIDFESESTNINDHAAFFKMCREDCGFDIEGL